MGSKKFPRDEFEQNLRDTQKKLDRAEKDFAKDKDLSDAIRQAKESSNKIGTDFSTGDIA